MTTLTAVGDNCLDVYLDGGFATTGGNCVNVAVNWARSDREAKYVGAVGADRIGRLIQTAVVAAGVDISALEKRPVGHTGVTFVRLIAGERVLIHEDLGVCADFGLDDASLAVIARDSDWVHVGGVPASVSLARRVAALGVRVSVDLSTAHEALTSLAGIEVAFASWTPRMAAAPFAVAQAIREAGAEMAVITGGSAGSWAYARDGRSTYAPAQRLRPVDTLGAGDSYSAAFTAALIDGADIAACARAATEAATATCMVVGAWPQARLAVPAELSALYNELAAPDTCEASGGDTW